jgi:tetratricopeptide (TPR) repeat protein
MVQTALSLRFDWQRVRAAAWFAGAVALLLCGMTAQALQVAPAGVSLEQRVAQDQDTIRAGEHEHMDPLKLGRLWAHLAVDYEDAAEFSKSENAYNRALKLFQATPEGAKDYAIALGNLGSLYLASGDFDAAERCRRQSMALREAAGDRLEIARGESHIAEVSLAKHHFKDAARESSMAYREMVEVKDSDASDLVSTLVTMTFASCMNKQCGEAVAHGREAVSLARESFPANSLPMGEAQMALGYAEWKTGLKDDADRDMREGIAALRAWMTPGHPYFLGAMRQYRLYLDQTHRKREAQQIAAEEKRFETAPANACSNCTISAYSLRAR